MPDLDTPSDLSSIEIPEEPSLYDEPWSWRKLKALLRQFGPAAIIASASIGAGETILVVRAGAWAGYDLLWLVLLSCLSKGVFVTYLLGRYTAISGEHVVHRLARLPGPRGWLPLSIVVLGLLGTPMGFTGVAKPWGDLAYFLLEDVLSDLGSRFFWQNLFTTGFMLTAVMIALRLSFAALEKQQIAICGVLVLGTILGTLLVRPDLMSTVKGSFSFGRLPDFPSWSPEDAVRHPLLTMATLFSFVGTGALGYLAYSSWVGLHGWGLTGHRQIDLIRDRAPQRDRIDYLPEDPGQMRRLRRLSLPLRWDIGMGAVVLFLVSVAFMVSGAAVLYPLKREFHGWNLLTHQADVWKTIHPGLVWVYYVSITVALWGTLQAMPEIFGRVTREVFCAVWPEREWKYESLKKFFGLYIVIVAMILVWGDVSFDVLSQVSGFLNGNLGVTLIMAAALYLNFKLPRGYRTRLPILFGAIATTIILILFAAISAWGLYNKLL